MRLRMVVAAGGGKMRNNQTEKSELHIPRGYAIDEFLDFDDSDLVEEKPLVVEEVIVHFE